MTTFALIHGGWGSGWHWGAIPEGLRAKGHAVFAPDLPCDDPQATFDDYAAVVIDGLDGVDDDVVVACFSLGGHTAPLVAAARPVKEIVYIAALLAEPGVSWADQLARGEPQILPEYLAGIERTPDKTGARWVDFDLYRRVAYDDDAAEHVVRERFDRLRAQYTGAYLMPCSLTEMPDVPSRYVLGSEDRLLNPEFWRAAVPERLGIEPIEIRSGHSVMVTHAEETLELLLARST